MFLEHLEISTQAKDMLEVARAHRNIGRIFQVQGHHERALGIHRKYLAIARQINNAEVLLLGALHLLALCPKNAH